MSPHPSKLLPLSRLKVDILPPFLRFICISSFLAGLLHSTCPGVNSTLSLLGFLSLFFCSHLFSFFIILIEFEIIILYCMFEQDQEKKQYDDVIKPVYIVRMKTLGLFGIRMGSDSRNTIRKRSSMMTLSMNNTSIYQKIFWNFEGNIGFSP